MLPATVQAQVTIEECWQKAQQNYPLVRRYDLIEKTKAYNLDNAAKGYLPQFSLSGKVSYQSDVTKIPVKVPGVTIEELSKDQYQVVAEMRQNIWDGGAVRMQKRQAEAEAAMERERQNVDMYALNSRVNDLFFGILLLDEQLQQNVLLQQELERNHRTISAYVANGIAHQADLDAVAVEQLNARQKQAELSFARDAYLRMLSMLTGEELAAGTRLQKPQPEPAPSSLADIRRPELEWFDAQSAALTVQEQALNVRHTPRFGLFVQGAYGNPGLDMLKNDFVPYYMAGVRMSWNFGSLYTLKNDRRKIGTQRKQLEVERDVFLFDTRLLMTQQERAVRAMEVQMKDDDEIVRLRTNIRRAAETKVANGTLTVAEMLRELTNENMARLAKALHEIQHLQQIYQMKYMANQ